jgi:hypothetical protein
MLHARGHAEESTSRVSHPMMTTVSVEVCSRIFAYPNECPCCGADPDSELMIPFKASSRMMAEDTARQILFPYCRRCIEHVSVWQAGSMTSTLLTLAGIIGGLVVAFTIGGWYGLLVFVAAVALAIFVTSMIQSRARARCQPSCASAARAVTYYGWSGSTSTFAFASATYTARFAEHNPTNLVSVDASLRTLLDAHKIARLQVPTPFTATRVVPSPRSTDEWIKHLEEQPSRVTRRMALVRALSTVYDDNERKTLVHVVCRAELVPFFEEIDALPSSTKRQRIERAIADVRADNIPEALRDAELRELKMRSYNLN